MNLGMLFESSAGKGLWSLLFDLGKGIVNNLEDRKQAERAARQYFEKYNHRYGKVQVLGMPRGIPLNEIYTPVRFLDDLSIQKFLSINALENNFRKERRFQQDKRSELNGLMVAKDEQYLTVLGGPGVGKSTFLRRIGLEAFKGKNSIFGKIYLPVFLELKKLNTEKVDLLQTIAEELSYFGFPINSSFVKKALNKKKLLLLFDGLDEVPKENTSKVVRAIEKLTTRYHNNRFIISCRIAAYQSNFPGFNAIEIADLEDDQIKGFIHRWFSSELDRRKKTANKCWEMLQQEKHKAAKELAQSHLLLTLLCLVYSKYQNFPKLRGQLYQKALDILLEEWAQEKQIHHQPIYDGFNIELEKDLLAEIAYKNFIDDCLFFQKIHLLSVIQEFLADYYVYQPKWTPRLLNYLIAKLSKIYWGTLNKSWYFAKFCQKSINSAEILKAIAVQQGILAERSSGIYSFSHLTFQEYLTARYLSKKPKILTSAVEKHLSDNRWQEVFILVNGINHNADQFLNKIEATTSRLINTPKLRKILVWADQITMGTSKTIHPVGRRAIAIAYAYAKAYTNINFKADANTITNANAKALAIVNVYADTTSAKVITDASAIAIAYANYYTNAHAIAHADAIAIDFNYDDTLVEAFAEPIIMSNAKPAILNYIKFFDILINYNIYPALNLSSVLDNLKSLDIQFAKSKNFNQEHKDLAQKLISTVNSALKLNKNLTNLSEQELKSLDNYLYANKLLIDCKKAAVRVKESTWKKIEARMLRLSSN